MAIHREICSENLTEDCSREIHRQIGIDFSMTKKCVDDSFINSTGDPKTAGDNKYLREDFVYKLRGGVWFLPEIMINQVVYKGQLDPDTVFEAICASFKEEPMYCKRFAPLTPTQEILALLTLAAMFCFVIFLNFLFIYLGNRMRRRMIQDESKQLV